MSKSSLLVSEPASAFRAPQSVD